MKCTPHTECTVQLFIWQRIARCVLKPRVHDARNTAVKRITYGLSFAVAAAGLQPNATTIAEREQTAIAEREQTATDELTMIIKRSILARMKGEFDEAERLCHEALTRLVPLQREKVFSAEKLLQVTVYVYDVMANLALTRGQFDKAETMFKETLKGFLQQGMEKDCNAVVDVSLKLAAIYAKQGNNAQAIQGYEFCIDTQKKKLSSGELDDTVAEDTKALLGLSMDCYAQCLIMWKCYAEAEEFLIEAMTIAQSVFDENDPQIATVQSNLGNVKSLLGKNVEATHDMEDALSIAKSSDSPTQAVLHCNLGNLCLNRGEATDAKRHCATALKMAKKLKDEDVVKQAYECLAAAKKMKPTGIFDGKGLFIYKEGSRHSFSILDGDDQNTSK